jgi:hypothetical protein
MPAGLALALLAQAAAATSYGPAAPPAPKPASTANQACATQRPGPDSREIVICAPKPNGYRLDPDVIAARKLKKRSDSGRPTRPGPIAIGGTPCGTVGPAPCMYGGVNLMAAAITAAEMAKRVAEGKEIGSMFVTDPHPSEYQLYLEAKHEREGEDREKTKVKDAARARSDETSAP